MSNSSLTCGSNMHSSVVSVVATPWLRNYLKAEPKLQDVAHVKPRCTLEFDCLAQCGLRDGNAKIGQFCIDTQLASALKGDVAKGLLASQ